MGEMPLIEPISAFPNSCNGIVPSAQAQVLPQPHDVNIQCALVHLVYAIRNIADQLFPRENMPSVAQEELKQQEFFRPQLERLAPAISPDRCIADPIIARNEIRLIQLKMARQGRHGLSVGFI